MDKENEAQIYQMRFERIWKQYILYFAMIQVVCVLYFIVYCVTHKSKLADPLRAPCVDSSQQMEFMW